MQCHHNPIELKLFHRVQRMHHMKKYKAIANKVSNQYSMFHKGGNFELTLPIQPLATYQKFLLLAKKLLGAAVSKGCCCMCMIWHTFSGKRCLGSWDSLSTCKYSHFTILLSIAAPNISLLVME